MTVGELIEQLQDLVRMKGDDILELDVMAAYDYGDHCHTTALVGFEEAAVCKPHSRRIVVLDWRLGMKKETSQRTMTTEEAR